MNRILADIIVVVHFVWILFMLYGFALTIRGFWRPAFFDRWLFRSVHLLGILFVAALEALGKYCPLTVWEYNLRHRGAREDDYPGSFIVDNIEELIYVDVAPSTVAAVTALVALTTLVIFVLRPPAKLRKVAR